MTWLHSGQKKVNDMAQRKHEMHGMYGTKLYKTWNNMISRCYCKSFRKYRNYGGRGITVCDEWKASFVSFMEWAMANGYREDLTIDRIDVNGNYEPSNCRWLTNEEQQLNKRTNRNIEYNGEIHPLTKWAKITGIHPKTISTRIDRGWSVEEALTKGVKTHNG